MRPGYLSGYGEDRTRPGNFGISDSDLEFLNNGVAPFDMETGYIPEYLRYSKVFPNLPMVANRPFVPLRPTRTFNTLMI